MIVTVVVVLLMVSLGGGGGMKIMHGCGIGSVVTA